MAKAKKQAEEVTEITIAREDQVDVSQRDTKNEIILLDKEKELLLPETETLLDDNEVNLPDPVFTKDDRADWKKYKQQLYTKNKEFWVIVEDIIKRRLYRIDKDENGDTMYLSQGHWAWKYFGKQRSWLNKGLNWLRVNRVLDRLGYKDIGQALGYNAAMVLGSESGKIEDAGGLSAIINDIKEDGGKFTETAIKDVVERRSTFTRKFGTSDPSKPAAKSQEEYKADLKVVEPLGRNGSPEIVHLAKDDTISCPGEFARRLVSYCFFQKKLPNAVALLTVSTGAELQEIMEEIKDLIRDIKEQDAVDKEKKALKEELKKAKKAVKEFNRQNKQPKDKEEEEEEDDYDAYNQEIRFTTVGVTTKRGLDALLNKTTRGKNKGGIIDDGHITIRQVGGYELIAEITDCLSRLEPRSEGTVEKQLRLIGLSLEQAIDGKYPDDKDGLLNLRTKCLQLIKLSTNIMKTIDGKLKAL